jgi:hypothetical protein
MREKKKAPAAMYRSPRGKLRQSAVTPGRALS